jgi:hypothetical protein
MCRQAASIPEGRLFLGQAGINHSGPKRNASLMVRTRESCWELSVIPAASTLIDEAVAAGSPLALGDVVGGLLLGDALLNHIQDR